MPTPTVSEFCLSPLPAGEPAPPEKPSTPFDGGPGADIILRSADDVDHRAHTTLLALASPLFADMFSLPHALGDDERTPDGLPVLRMQDRAEDLALVLPLCYPYPDGAALARADLRTLDTALALACKLQLDAAVRTYLAPALLAHADAHAYRVFAIAWSHGLPRGVLRAAARATLRHASPPMAYHGDYERLPAGALIKLLVFRRECAARVSALAGAEGIKGWVHRSDVPRTVEAWCNADCPMPNIMIRGGRSLTVRSWWKAYMDAAGPALEHRPHPETITRIAFLAPALTEAGRCAQCKGEAYAEALESWSKRFGVEIDKVISEVRTFSLG
jgi:hypothetical protein